MGKVNSVSCVYQDSDCDMAHHTVLECSKWKPDRDELKQEDKILALESLIDKFNCEFTSLHFRKNDFNDEETADGWTLIRKTIPR